MGTNRYAYAGNDPINNADSNGHAPIGYVIGKLREYDAASAADHAARMAGQRFAHAHPGYALNGLKDPAAIAAYSALSDEERAYADSESKLKSSGVIYSEDTLIDLAAGGVVGIARNSVREGLASLFAKQSAKTTASSRTLFKNLAPQDKINAASLFSPDHVRKAAYSGNLNYVVMDSGKLVLGKSEHISLSKGKDVLAGGKARFVGGASSPYRQ